MNTYNTKFRLYISCRYTIKGDFKRVIFLKFFDFFNSCSIFLPRRSRNTENVLFFWPTRAHVTRPNIESIMIIKRIKAFLINSKHYRTTINRTSRWCFVLKIASICTSINIQVISCFYKSLENQKYLTDSNIRLSFNLNNFLYRVNKNLK